MNLAQSDTFARKVRFVQSEILSFGTNDSEKCSGEDESIELTVGFNERHNGSDLTKNYGNNKYDIESVFDRDRRILAKRELEARHGSGSLSVFDQLKSKAEVEDNAIPPEIASNETSAFTAPVDIEDLEYIKKLKVKQAQASKEERELETCQVSEFLEAQEEFIHKRERETALDAMDKFSFDGKNDVRNDQVDETQVESSFGGPVVIVRKKSKKAKKQKKVNSDRNTRSSDSSLTSSSLVSY